jgi:lysine 2,3-aminomutase
MPRLPERVTPFYRALARTQDPLSDPVAAQFIPTHAEERVLAYETSDPLEDRRYTVTPGLVHHYRDRVLLLVNDRCAVHCRHCFRTHYTGQGSGTIPDEDLAAACRYIDEHPEVQEVLLSGGDPLTENDRDLFRIIEALRSVRNLVLRLCTRVPVVNPDRVSSRLVRRLGLYGAVWVVVQVNHPWEITPEFERAVSLFLTHRIPVLNQAVLLRGVNDSADVLEDLLRRLYRIGVKPYYLFQGDLAAGTSHFRVPVEKGVALMQEIRKRLTGPAVPVYAVDLGDGGGKVPVESCLVRIENERYVFRAPDGREIGYPRE